MQLCFFLSLGVKGEVIPMIATSKIKMDLANLQRQVTIDAVQDDRYSRSLQISLYTGGIAYTPPQNCTVLVRYRKPDGKTGIYDTLPDGSQAWRISGNTVTVALAPQVCTVSGQAELTVSLLWGDAQLSSFRIGLNVHPQPGRASKSEAYLNISSFIPQPRAAQVGQYLKVTGVKNGKITAVETGAVSGGDPGVSPGSAPDYVAEEACRVAQAAMNRQNGSTLTFLACSDPHYAVSHIYSKQMTESVSHCAQAMALVANQLHVDFAAMLGDLVWDGGEGINEAVSAMTFVNSALANCFGAVPNFRTRGNHDCLANGSEILADSQIFARVGIYNSGAAFDPNNRVGGYCCRDFPEQKLRVILLNTSEASDGSFALSQGQLDWFARVLDLTALGEGWGSMVLSHHPLDWYGSSHAAVQALKAAGGVLCCIHGHVHNYKVDTVAGTAIPRIAIPNICFYRNNEYGANGRPENDEGIEFGESQTYDKTAGTARDTAFCVVTLDRAAGKVYADHYGAGYSRVVRLDGGAVPMHSIICDLDGVSITAIPTELAAGSAFAAWLTANNGGSLGSVSVTMGGTDVTDQVYDGGLISIGAVTGDLVITAAASGSGGSTGQPEENTENQVPGSIDTDGSILGGTGYLSDCRLSSSGSTTALSGAIVSGYIAYRGQAICISGSAASSVGTLGNYLGLYDSSFQLINTLGFDNLVSYGSTWVQSGAVHQLTVDPEALTNEAAREQLLSAAYIRCSLGKAAPADFCVTFSGEGNAPAEPVTYPVVNQLTHVVNSNSAAQVTEGAGYSAMLTPAEGYRIDSVAVTMGGVDVTASAYTYTAEYGEGLVSIAAVTGSIVITASAAESSGGESGGTESPTVYQVNIYGNEITYSNSQGLVTEGEAYSNTITANEGFAIERVSVSMGGDLVGDGATDITAECYAGGVVTIPAVTGHVVIYVDTAVLSAGPVNLVPTATDADGSILNGCGYITGYRLNSSGTITALAGAIASGFIPYAGQTVCISGSAASTPGTVGNYLCLYDGSKAKINSLSFDNLVSYGGVWQQNGTYQLTVDPAALTNTTVQDQMAAAAYIRGSLGSPESEAAFSITLTETP